MDEATEGEKDEDKEGEWITNSIKATIFIPGTLSGARASAFFALRRDKKAQALHPSLVETIQQH